MRFFSYGLENIKPSPGFTQTMIINFKNIKCRLGFNPAKKVQPVDWVLTRQKKCTIAAGFNPATICGFPIFQGGVLRGIL